MLRYGRSRSRSDSPMNKDNVTSVTNRTVVLPASSNATVVIGAGGAKTATTARYESGTFMPRVPGCRIIRRLGVGGMGTVYLAEQRALGRQVAIKVLSERYLNDLAFLARLRNEAEVMAAFSHPNLVSCHDIIISRSGASIIMEYIPGGLNGVSLVKMLGPMPERHVVRVMADIASGLAYAYGKGFIHRDVKPENILFAFAPERLPDSYDDLFSQPDFRVVLCDFGITEARAKFWEDQTDGNDSDAYGTPMYMAPEQAALNERVDCRADIFSLGATAYFLATGKEPFPYSGWHAIQKAKLDNGVPELHDGEAGRRFSARFSRLVWQMTRVLPEERLGSYEELGAALEMLSQAQADRRQPWRMFFSMHRRRLLQTILGIQVALVLVLGGTYAYFRAMNRYYVDRLERATLDSHWTGEVSTWQRRLEADSARRIYTANENSRPIRLFESLGDGDYVTLTIRMNGSGDAFFRLLPVHDDDEEEKSGRLRPYAGNGMAGQLVVSGDAGKLRVRMFSRVGAERSQPWMEVPLPPGYPFLNENGTLTMRIQVMEGGYCLWSGSTLLGIGHFMPWDYGRRMWIEVDPSNCTSLAIEQTVVVEGRFDRYGRFLKNSHWNTFVREWGVQ